MTPLHCACGVCALRKSFGYSFLQIKLHLMYGDHKIYARLLKLCADTENFIVQPELHILVKLLRRRRRKVLF